MNKKIDKKSILNRAKDKTTRVKATFSLEAEVLENFQKACKKEKAAMSRVIEELMKSFSE